MDEQIYHVARSARLKAVAAVLFPIVICAIDPVPDLYPPRTRDLTLLTLSQICIRPEREI
jgi:hypothetical protein